MFTPVAPPPLREGRSVGRDQSPSRVLVSVNVYCTLYGPGGGRDHETQLPSKPSPETQSPPCAASALQSPEPPKLGCMARMVQPSLLRDRIESQRTRAQVLQSQGLDDGRVSEGDQGRAELTCTRARTIGLAEPTARLRRRSRHQNHHSPARLCSRATFPGFERRRKGGGCTYRKSAPRAQL